MKDFIGRIKKLHLDVCLDFDERESSLVFCVEGEAANEGYQIFEINSNKLIATHSVEEVIDDLKEHCIQFELEPTLERVGAMIESSLLKEFPDGEGSTFDYRRWYWEHYGQILRSMRDANEK